ncbi:MAG: hypothetical protein GYA51_11060 [Candidatus Methanofastidiosa archaeon]|nr:hypothetical protein [Candidatus Methanofastidiosa archaeon]
MHSKENSRNLKLYPNRQLVNLSIKKLIFLLIIIAVFLFVLSLTGQLLKYLTDYEEAFGLIPLVYMGKALSIPTIFQMMLIYIITLILILICLSKASKKDDYIWNWIGLALFFFLFSLDKGSALETYIFKEFRRLISCFFPDFPRQKWISNFLLLSIIIVIFYKKFISELTRETKRNIINSICLYYLGFLIIERFAYDYAKINSSQTLLYSILITIGKTFEIFGLIEFIYGLLNYYKKISPEIFIDLLNISNK